jgi:hypothetical protein
MTALGTLTEELANEAMARATALEVSQGQSGINGGTGWRGIFLADAEACDEVSALLVKKAQECGIEITLPVLDAPFTQARSYLGRAARAEGMGPWGIVIASDIAPGADAFWEACIALGIPSETLPARDGGSWVANWGKGDRPHKFLAELARGLLELERVVSSWSPAQTRDRALRRKRA